MVFTWKNNITKCDGNISLSLRLFIVSHPGQIDVCYVEVETHK